MPQHTWCGRQVAAYCQLVNMPDSSIRVVIIFRRAQRKFMSVWMQGNATYLMITQCYNVIKEVSMPDTDNNSAIRIDPEDRIVVLARTLNIYGADLESELKDEAIGAARFGELCLGQALYRHRSVFQDASEAPVWSHLELSYFSNIVPTQVIQELVTGPHRNGLQTLRAELLVTTPLSFIMASDWQGSASRPELQVSLEYIDVQPRQLGKYRDAMNDFCGPAAQKLVKSGKFGTFRAMETAAILFHEPDFPIEWNQIHLCELMPDGFEGFGSEFEAVLREDLPEGAELPGTFASLGKIRTVPRWTFNDSVVEADAGVLRIKG